MKVLMIGHGCNPYSGSEPGTTWGWASQMAKDNTVHLISYPKDRKAVEMFLSRNSRPSLNLHWIESGSEVDRWKPQYGEKGIRLHYLLWMKRVRTYAQRLHEIEAFDLVHHVSWSTVSVPSPFWRLKIPEVWGPLGGGQACPVELLSIFKSVRERGGELLRTWRIRALPLLPAFRSSVQRSFAVLATNHETANLLKKAGARTVHLLMDSALHSEYIPKEIPRRPPSETLNLLCAGRLVRLKGLDLAILALHRLGQDAGVKLVIAGTGPLQSEYVEQVRRLNLQGVISFRGNVPWENMAHEFRSADALLFPSTRDSLGSVVLEAAAHGLPFIALDVSGAASFFPDAAGIKITPSTVDATVAAIARAILELRDNPARRQVMGRNAYGFARGSTWDLHGAYMQRIYDDAVQASSRRQPA